MGNLLFSFKRYEKKYILTPELCERFFDLVGGRLITDEYGETTICNIYYDTPSFELIRASVEKPIYKEKLRVRSYGVPSDGSTVFVEVKKKYDDIVYKRRIAMTLAECREYFADENPPETSQIEREINWVRKFYHPSPAVFIAYDHTAMTAKDDTTVRVTFDKNIRYRRENLELEYGDFGTNIFSNGEILMEIKTATAVPLWLCGILSELKIYPTSFSKYGSCYTGHMLYVPNENAKEAQYV